MSAPVRLLDGLLKVAAAAAVGAACLGWLENGRLASELDGLRSERDGLVAAARVQTAALGKAAADEDAADAAIAAFDLSAFDAKVSQALQRLEDPRFAHLTRRQLDSDYAALFRQLRLPEDRLAILKGLLADRLHVEREALQLAMAEDLSLDDMPDEKEILAAGTDAIDSAMARSLGAATAEAFETYQASMSARKFMIKPFADHLRFGPDALTDAQVDALADAASQVPFGANTIIARPPAPPIPPTVDAAAARSLSPAQRAAYQDYTAVWEAGRQKAALDLASFAQKQASMAHAPSR